MLTVGVVEPHSVTTLAMAVLFMENPKVKKATVLATIILSVIVSGLVLNGKADQNQAPPKHEVVILWAYQGGIVTNGVYRYNGAQIYCSSSSAGAPQFPQGTGSTLGTAELAEALAQLLDNGFRIQQGDGLHFVMVR